jgi:hypothetical protein
MGLSCSWVAVKDGKKDDILKKFDLVETGEEVDPGCRTPGTPLSYFEWPTGWFILVSEDYEWVDRDRLLDLSQFGPTVGYRMLENVEAGFCAASAAENGVVLWRVAHNGNTGKIEVSGNPPEEFIDIRDQIMREQEEKDGANYILDIPTELAKAVTGYRLDNESMPFKGLQFTGTNAHLNQKHNPSSPIGTMLFLFSLPFRVAFWAVTSPFTGKPKETEL